MADFTRAIEIDSSDPDPFNSRGWALLQEQKAESTIKDFDKALQLNPQYTLAYYNRGSAKLLT